MCGFGRLRKPEEKNPRHGINERFADCEMRKMYKEGKRVAIVTIEEARELAGKARRACVDIAQKPQPPFAQLVVSGNYGLEESNKLGNLIEKELLQLPEATSAAPALLVGFADMFLPAVLAKDIDSELTRFVIISVSITQLIYLSDVGFLILKTRIPVNFLDLVVVFLLRTLITLPIIAAIAHWVVF